MATKVLDTLMLKIWVTHQVKELGQLSSWPSQKKAWAASEAINITKPKKAVCGHYFLIAHIVCYVVWQDIIMFILLHIC